MIDNKIFIIKKSSKKTTIVRLRNSTNKYSGNVEYLDKDGGWKVTSLAPYSSTNITICIPGYFEIDDSYAPTYTIDGNFADLSMSFSRSSGHLITEKAKS